MLSGSGRLAVGNSKEVWSQIDEEEQVMAADGGSWAKQSRRIVERLREEANGCLLGRMVAQTRKTTEVIRDRGMHNLGCSVRGMRKWDFGKEE